MRPIKFRLGIGLERHQDNTNLLEVALGFVVNIDSANDQSLDLHAYSKTLTELQWANADYRRAGDLWRVDLSLDHRPLGRPSVRNDGETVLFSSTQHRRLL